MAVNKDKNDFITLREAAEISGYSSDYIGQLIRSGKLEGKQVFSNVSWVTTKAAVLEYTRKDKKGELSLSTTKKAATFSIPEFISKAYSVTGWTVVVVLSLFLLLLVYIVAVSVDHRINANYLEQIQYAR